MLRETLLPNPKKLSCSNPALKLKPVPEPPKPAPILKFPESFSLILTFRSILFAEPGTRTSSNTTFSTNANLLSLLFD